MESGDTMPDTLTPRAYLIALHTVVITLTLLLLILTEV